MKYRNIKSGAIIDVPSEIGGNWVKIDGGKPEKAAAVAPVSSDKEEKPAKKTVRKTKK